jgi:hypothetical protein
MARETAIAAVVGRRYWREAEARVVVEAWRAIGATQPAAGQRHVELDAGELGLMLEGVDLRGAARRVRWRRLPAEAAAVAVFARG